MQIRSASRELRRLVPVTIIPRTFARCERSNTAGRTVVMRVRLAPMSTMGVGAGGKGRSSLRSRPGNFAFAFSLWGNTNSGARGLRGYWKNASSVTVLGTGEGGSAPGLQGLPKNNVLFPAPPPPKESPNISHRTCQILLPKTFRFLGRPFTFFVVRFFGGAGGRENTLFLGKPCSGGSRPPRPQRISVPPGNISFLRRFPPFKDEILSGGTGILWGRGGANPH